MFGRATTYIALTALLTLSVGCDLFSPREPENPSNAGSQFEPAITPSIVLRNMQSALSFANAADYRRCFADSSKGLPGFSFHPSVQGAAADPGAFLDWGADDEEEYLRNIFAELQPGTFASLSLDNPDVTEVPIGDSVQYTSRYTVRFPHTRAGAEREASGTLQFTLRRSEQNEWFITRWRDISDGTSNSWSLIKARFIDR